MPKQIPWHLQEIFGASTVEESLDAIAPVIYPKPADVPVLDTAPELRDFGKSGAAFTEVQGIEFASMVDLLAPTPDISADVARFSPPAKPAAGLDFVKHVLDLGAERMARKAAITAGDQRRSESIGSLVDDWADHHDIATDGTRDALARIKRSMAACANHTVLEAAL
ncbi:MAG: hypothetical protein WAU76_19305 [Candidatus Sulfotelmatobacter sp.]